MLATLSLRTRVVAAATVLFTVVLTLGGWVVATALQREMTSDVARAAALRSQDLSALAANDRLPRPIPIGDADEALVQVVVDGRVVAASANVEGQAPVAVTPPAVGATRLTRVGTLPIVEEGDTASFVIAATSVRTDAGVATVLVASSLENVVESLGEIVRTGLVALPVLVVVLAAGTWVLVGRALAPVDAIRAEAEAITGSDLHRRVPEPASRDEVGRLARTLNGMLGRLEDASERQRRFVADAAHELRTPVASIRTTLETARSSPRRIDWDEVADDVLADAVRMQALSEQLLLLARVDAGRLAERRRTVDLDDVIGHALERRRPVAGVSVDATHVEPAQVLGEPILLEQLVRNLVENATAHARTRVEVSLHARGGDAVLRVDDDGPGIPADQREQVFERFTRLDRSRARAEAGAGAGLGLAIVADIAAAHAGTVSVADAPTGGARLEVRIPRSS